MSDDTLTAALARAQAKFGTLKKSKTATVPTKSGGSYSYAYADLADLLAAVLPSLNNEGVFLSHPIEIHDGHVSIGAVVEKNGERREAWLPLPLDGMQPQAVGSLMTYWKRYLTSSLLGVAAEDDDDGRAANDAPVKYRADGSESVYKAQQRPTGRELDARPGSRVEGPARPATDKQKQKLNQDADKVRAKFGWSVAEMAEVFIAAVGKDGADVMTTREASAAIDLLIEFKEGRKHAEFDEDGKAHLIDVESEEPF